MKIRNTHTRITSLALAVALSLGATITGPLSGVAQAAETKPPAKPAVSRKLVKPLQAAQEAIGAKKFDEAVAALKTVEASTERTPYDTFVMSQLFGFALVQLKQNAEAIPLLRGHRRRRASSSRRRLTASGRASHRSTTSRRTTPRPPRPGVGSSTPGAPTTRRTRWSPRPISCRRTLQR